MVGIDCTLHKRHSSNTNGICINETFEEEKSDKNNDFSDILVRYKIIAFGSLHYFHVR
jgi:hypothetical protein